MKTIMKEPLIISNIPADPTCLIFNGEVNSEGTLATLNMWSMADVSTGTVIKSNWKLGFRMSDSNPERFVQRDFEVVDVLSQEDFKGQWTYDREKKNKQSKYTVTVIPWAMPIGS